MREGDGEGRARLLQEGEQEIGDAMGGAPAPSLRIAFAGEAERGPDLRRNGNLLRDFRRDQEQRSVDAHAGECRAGPHTAQTKRIRAPAAV